MTVYWTQRQDIGPSARSGHALGYDGSRKRTMLFGGAAGGGVLGDTWAWDGSVWTQLEDIGPSKRSGHAICYDAAHDQLVLFGGKANGDLGDTWAWDGTDWTQLGDTGPSARHGHAVCFDAPRGKVVLFGGRQGDAGLLGDTWEWDGSEWTQVQDVGPSPRAGHALCFDRSAARTVLFGGSAASETWVFENPNWTQLADTGPDPCEQTALVFAGAPFLFGGVNPAGAPPAVYGLTWELDGQNWTERQDIGPPARWGHAMSFDCDRGRIVLFGGSTAAPGDEGGLAADTWELPAQAAVGGGGQPGQPGEPVVPGQVQAIQITVIPNLAGPGIQLTLEVALSAPPDGDAVVVLGIDDVPNQATITVPGGQTQAQELIQSDVVPLGQHNLTATYGGATVSTTFTRV